MTEKQQLPTRNIAKSGKVLNWSGLSPFQLHLGLIVNRSQSASCHIATVGKHLKTDHETFKHNIDSNFLSSLLYFVWTGFY
jgi:hypothetical protein